MKLSEKKYYSINFDKLVVLLLPTFLRKSKLVAFLKVLVAPIKKIHNDFRRQQAENWHRLNHNGQVFSLQKVLNDAYAPSSRGIRIKEGCNHERTYIYPSLVEKPLYISGKSEAIKYIYTKEEYEDGVGFLVSVPGNLMSFIPRLKELVDTYKLITTTYEIEKYG